MIYKTVLKAFQDLYFVHHSLANPIFLCPLLPPTYPHVAPWGSSFPSVLAALFFPCTVVTPFRHPPPLWMTSTLVLDDRSSVPSCSVPSCLSCCCKQGSLLLTPALCCRNSTGYQGKVNILRNKVHLPCLISEVC